MGGELRTADGRWEKRGEGHVFPNLVKNLQSVPLWSL